MDGPWRRRPDEDREAWQERMRLDWPETLKTLRVFFLLDEYRDKCRARRGVNGSSNVLPFRKPRT